MQIRARCSLVNVLLLAIWGIKSRLEPRGRIAVSVDGAPFQLFGSGANKGKTSFQLNAVRDQRTVKPHVIVAPLSSLQHMHEDVCNVVYFALSKGEKKEETSA